MIKFMQSFGDDMPFINHYSFTIIAVIAIMLLAYFLFRKGFEASNLTLIGALILGLVLAFLILRPGPSTSQDSEEVLAQIGVGQPVLLEFQSNYWIACLSAKPIVDGIEREFAGKLTVIHLDIHEPVGQELGEIYRFQYTPTFILLDGEGEEVWRTIGAINPSDVRRSLDLEWYVVYSLNSSTSAEKRIGIRVYPLQSY
jgi:thiol-disulfide isomerase/thioredoxin